MAQENINRHHPAVSRDYRNDAIAVYWEPGLCIHAAECIRRLPTVFDPYARPWIDVGGAGADTIAEIVAACPSGALRFERLDGGPQEVIPETTSISPQPDGPCYVRGRVEVKYPDGSTETISRAALCRCGASENKPFCDLSHRMIGFQAP